jgi:hypothetical protein
MKLQMRLANLKYLEIKQNIVAISKFSHFVTCIFWKNYITL